MDRAISMDCMTLESKLSLAKSIDDCAVPNFLKKTFSILEVKYLQIQMLNAITPLC